MRPLHISVCSSEGQRTGGGGSLALPRIAPLEEAAWTSRAKKTGDKASPPTPSTPKEGLSISGASAGTGPGSDGLLPQPQDSAPRPPGKFPVCVAIPAASGVAGVLPLWAEDLGAVGAENGHTGPSPDLTSDPSCLHRDLLPFKLRLPQAILEASSCTDLKTISNLGLGKSPLGSGEVAGP